MVKKGIAVAFALLIGVMSGIAYAAETPEAACEAAATEEGYKGEDRDEFIAECIKELKEANN